MKHNPHKHASARHACRFVPVVVVALFLLGLRPAIADDYAAGWGPLVGTEIPMLEAPDQSGRLRTLADLVGEQGLLLFLSRSADW